MNQRKAKALRKYAVALITRHEADRGEPLQNSHTYSNGNKVNINHKHRIIRRIVRKNRILNIMGLSKQVKSK
jgi:hypothetical protein